MWRNQAIRQTILLIVAIFAGVVAAGCGRSRVTDLPTSDEDVIPTLAMEGQLTMEGPSIASRGTLKSGGASCRFMTVEGGWEGICGVHEFDVAVSGIIEAVVHWSADAPLAAFLKDAAGGQIEIACCGQPSTLRAPVRAGRRYRLEVAYIGRPAGYPSIGTVNYEVVTRLLSEARAGPGTLRTILFADQGRTQRLATGRVEIASGPLAGRRATFDATTGTYDIGELPRGWFQIRASAEQFGTVTLEVPVGVTMPQEINLVRTIPLRDATHSLGGWMWATQNSAYDDAKIEILDGPQAGIFSFSVPEWGFYVLEGLVPGVITVRASRPGVRSITQTVQVAGRTKLDFRWW